MGISCSARGLGFGVCLTYCDSWGWYNIGFCPVLVFLLASGGFWWGLGGLGMLCWFVRGWFGWLLISGV